MKAQGQLLLIVAAQPVGPDTAPGLPDRRGGGARHGGSIWVDLGARLSPEKNQQTGQRPGRALRPSDDFFVRRRDSAQR